MKSYSQYVRLNQDGIEELYPFDYLDYYAKEIHPFSWFTVDDKDIGFFDGITADEFRKKNAEQGFIDDKLEKIINDENIEKLQEELEKEGKQVCPINIYILSLFLFERAKSRYLFLLKPNLNETLSALNDVSNITFTNKDGSTVESKSNILIQTVVDALEANKERFALNYEVEKIVTWDKVSNKSIILASFVNDMANFLHSYFPVKRKKDALVSVNEVDLILYLLSFFGYAYGKLNNKRYWQLMNLYKRIEENYSTDIGEFTINGEKRYMPMLFIPYSVWSNGNIDWTDENLTKFVGVKGTTIKFPKEIN